VTTCQHRVTGRPQDEDRKKLKGEEDGTGGGATLTTRGTGKLRVVDKYAHSVFQFRGEEKQGEKKAKEKNGKKTPGYSKIKVQDSDGYASGGAFSAPRRSCARITATAALRMPKRTTVPAMNAWINHKHNMHNHDEEE